MATTQFTREQAAERALKQTRNTKNMCQLVTRTWLGAPSAGDFDGDGAADAEDGWKREPASARHSDRKPPRGTPVSYLGGSNDNGHRALSLGPDKNGKYHIRSTDAGGWGVTATVPLDWPEREWGLKYVGWSDTCDGVPIKPSAAKPGAKKPKPKTSRGPAIEMALSYLRKAKATKGTKRYAHLKAALEHLSAIDPIK